MFWMAVLFDPRPAAGLDVHAKLKPAGCRGDYFYRGIEGYVGGLKYVPV